MTKNESEKDQISVNRVKYDQITLYEISEEQLEIIERGSPASTYLNIALVLLTTFSSFLASLFLADIKGKTFTVFVVITVVTGVVGVILLYIWKRTRKDSSEVFKKIRNKKSVEKIRELATQDDEIENEQETI